MTLETIFKEVQYLLKKKGKEKPTNTELIGYANDCHEDMIKRLPPADLLNLKKEATLTRITGYTHTTLENSEGYVVPTDYLRIINIFDADKLINATLIEEIDARIYQAFSFYFAPSYTNPVYYFSHKSGDNKVVCFCPVSGDIVLHYYKQATVMTAIANTPEVDAGVHRLFIPFIFYRVTGDTKFYEEYDKKIKERGGK